MKTKNIFFFPIFAGLMLFASCSDLLDKEPYGQFTVNQMDTTSV